MDFYPGVAVREKFSQRSPGSYLHSASINHLQSSSLSYRGAYRDHFGPDAIRSSAGGQQTQAGDEDKDKVLRLSVDSERLTFDL